MLTSESSQEFSAPRASHETIDALYVGCASAGVLALLKQTHALAEVTRGRTHIALPLSIEDEVDRDDWARLSLRLGVPVFHLVCRSLTDTFRYERFEGGRSQRALQYGCERRGVWEVVEGDAEPWEVGAFFGGSKGRAGATDARRAAVESAWRGTLRAGAYFPVIDVAATAKAVSAYHRLHGT